MGRERLSAEPDSGRDSTVYGMAKRSTILQVAFVGHVVRCVILVRAKIETRRRPLGYLDPRAETQSSNNICAAAV